jgi:hypothetical protein
MMMMMMMQMLDGAIEDYCNITVTVFHYRKLNETTAFSIRSSSN